MSVTLAKRSGTLYVVATPIGNLEDITLRAIRTLKTVDLIAAEDTRHTRKLLNHFGIHTKLISYYREKEMERGQELIERIKGGETIALVTDAGSPGISDPGAIVVQMAHEAQINVSPIPGATAVTAAISVAGLETPSFLFLGFPPAKKKQRRDFLHSLKNSPHPLVFYESVHRFHHLLADSLETLGNRRAFMAREITKSFENLVDSSLKKILEEYNEDGTITRKGEFVLIIHPGQTTEAKGSTIEELLIWYRDQTDLSLKDVSQQLASDLGLSRSKIYQKALSIWKDKTEDR